MLNMLPGLDAATVQRINTWLNGHYDPETKATIQALIDAQNVTELTDAFYKDLEFGTGGLRGIIGTGSNKMNRYTVGAATQGLSNYLNKTFPGQGIKVAIAHDSRNMSPEFARIAADVFSANGIHVFLFGALRPTPELSFTIRHLGCHSGVVITASHNPREYNGYKAYWNDGSQVVAPHDKNIVAEVNHIQSVDDIRFQGNPALITVLSADIDNAYLGTVIANCLNPQVIQRQHDLKIVYTSIHGTGITMVPRALEQIGFTNVHIVKEQADPDGNFPTVVYPNPEEEEAMTMALSDARKLDADLVIATDPDADRVGAAVKNKKGEWQLLNGNQMASLIIYYMLQAWKESGKLQGSEFVAKTIVTTNIIDAMCAAYGVPCYNTLTGFKYIAQVIRELEGKAQFISGGEESYGMLIGDAVRDKDAVAACAMIAELTAFARDKGLTLFDFLTEMYMKHGFYYEGLVSLTRKGKSGAEEIRQMMANLRGNLPAAVNGAAPVEVFDYLALTHTDLRSGKVTHISEGMGIEKSNVLQLVLADGTKVSARPSGTEPKIKFYVSVNAPLEKPEDFDRVYTMLQEKVKAVTADLGLN
jgi:phosphoglucomutase